MVMLTNTGEFKQGEGRRRLYSAVPILESYPSSCSLRSFIRFSLNRGLSLAGGSSSAVLNIACCIWNGQAETDAPSPGFNRTAMPIHDRGCTSGGFLHLVFTRMSGESYGRRLGSFSLYLCYVFRALIISPCVLIRYRIRLRSVFGRCYPQLPYGRMTRVSAPLPTNCLVIVSLPNGPRSR